MQIPAAFTPVEIALPMTDKPVLVVRRSGYNSARFEVLTGRYMPDYRPRNPWQTISNDAITDSGEEVLGWMGMDEWLQGKPVATATAPREDAQARLWRELDESLDDSFADEALGVLDGLAA